jgi:uncharacterized membrane protein YidH (DUF202 family)
MRGRIPPLALLIGVLGLIPFVMLSLGSVSANTARDQVSVLLLIGWGAVILSFLGGVHWGFALEDEAPPAERSRLVLGVVPALIGWVSFAVSLSMAAATIGLAVLIAGYVGTIVVEWRASRRDLLPAGYIWLRLGLTVVVVALLTTVVVLRLVGAHLLFGF